MCQAFNMSTHITLINCTVILVIIKISKPQLREVIWPNSPRTRIWTQVPLCPTRQETLPAYQDWHYPKPNTLSPFPLQTHLIFHLTIFFESSDTAAISALLQAAAALLTRPLPCIHTSTFKTCTEPTSFTHTLLSQQPQPPRALPSSDSYFPRWCTPFWLALHLFISITGPNR